MVYHSGETGLIHDPFAWTLDSYINYTEMSCYMAKAPVNLKRYNMNLDCKCMVRWSWVCRTFSLYHVTLLFTHIDPSLTLECESCDLETRTSKNWLKKQI